VSYVSQLRDDPISDNGNCAAGSEYATQDELDIAAMREN
jgi:hypothetical protein